jgi:hypothetical protein
VLFFELFPAVFAVVALITAIALFAVNRRAAGEPEQPRSPSQPVVDPDDPAASATGRRRPSMTA